MESLNGSSLCKHTLSSRNGGFTYVSVALQSIHKKMGPGFGDPRIWRFFVISLYTVQCCEIRTLKKGPKRVPQLGFEPHNALLQARSNGLDFDGFSQFNAFGAKPGRYPILVMACFLDK